MLHCSWLPALSIDHSPKCEECTCLIQSLSYLSDCVTRDCNVTSISVCMRMDINALTCCQGFPGKDFQVRVVTDNRFRDIVLLMRCRKQVRNKPEDPHMKFLTWKSLTTGKDIHVGIRPSLSCCSIFVGRTTLVTRIAEFSVSILSFSANSGIH